MCLVRPNEAGEPGKHEVVHRRDREPNDIEAQHNEK
jgi:hypothetical protein